MKVWRFVFLSSIMDKCECFCEHIRTGVAGWYLRYLQGRLDDFCISNPPFGTPWKEDLKNWDLGDKKEVTDPRFFDGATSFIPDIGDCQMLFLANNVSRMKNTTLGSRIVEVHNGSSLFTGNAGGGESNLRRYIIENDLLEAIIAMPEKDFYNTGISTSIVR